LLSFSAESFIFQFATQKYKDQDVKNLILLVVWYGCKAWYLTLREEHRLRVFENRVLRKIIGPKRKEITRGWRRLHNKELFDLYSLTIIVWSNSEK
jgi:hypothetical protein